MIAVRGRYGPGRTRPGPDPEAVSTGRTPPVPDVQVR